MFEDERDNMLGDKAYFDQKRESQQRRRDRMEKRRAEPPSMNKYYAEDEYYNNRYVDDRYYRMSNEPFPGERHHRHHTRPVEDDSDLLAKKIAKKKALKKEK